MPSRIRAFQSAIRPFRRPSIQTRHALSSRGPSASGAACGRDETGFAKAKDDFDVTRRGGVEAAAMAATQSHFVGGYCRRAEFGHGTKAWRNPRRAAVQNAQAAMAA